MKPCQQSFSPVNTAFSLVSRASGNDRGGFSPQTREAMRQKWEKWEGEKNSAGQLISGGQTGSLTHCRVKNCQTLFLVTWTSAQLNSTTWQKEQKVFPGSHTQNYSNTLGKDTEECQSCCLQENKPQFLQSSASPCFRNKGYSKSFKLIIFNTQNMEDFVAKKLHQHKPGCNQGESNWLRYLWHVGKKQTEHFNIKKNYVRIEKACNSSLKHLFELKFKEASYNGLKLIIEVYFS